MTCHCCGQSKLVSGALGSFSGAFSGPLFGAMSRGMDPVLYSFLHASPLGGPLRSSVMARTNMQVIYPNEDEDVREYRRRNWRHVKIARPRRILI